MFILVKNARVNVHKQHGHDKGCTGTRVKSISLGLIACLCLVTITWLWGQSEVIVELAAIVIILYLSLH